VAARMERSVRRMVFGYQSIVAEIVLLCQIDLMWPQREKEAMNKLRSLRTPLTLNSHLL